MTMMLVALQSRGNSKGGGVPGTRGRGRNCIARGWLRGSAREVNDETKTRGSFREERGVVPEPTTQSDASGSGECSASRSGNFFFSAHHAY